MEDNDYDPYWDDQECPECPTCKGTGFVNPLIAPKREDFLCLGTTTCPDCEGSGDCQ